VTSGSRKTASWPKTAFEEIGISPHEEILKGTERYLRGMQPQHYIEPDCVGAKFSGREPGLAAQTIQNNLLPWIEVG